MTQTDSEKVVWDHLTINVSDIERASRFYCNGLGFQHLEDHVRGNEAARANRVQGDFEVHSRYLQGGDRLLILNHVNVPAVSLPRPRPQLGLTNFALRVPDLDLAIKRVGQAGGEVFEDTRSRFELGSATWADIVVCADPDGQWIELIQHCGAPLKE